MKTEKRRRTPLRVIKRAARRKLKKTFAVAYYFFLILLAFLFSVAVIAFALIPGDLIESCVPPPYDQIVSLLSKGTLVLLLILGIRSWWKDPDKFEYDPRKNGWGGGSAPL